MSETASKPHKDGLLVRNLKKVAASRTYAFVILLVCLSALTAGYAWYQFNRVTDTCMSAPACDEASEDCSNDPCRVFWEEALMIGDGVDAELIANRGRLERFVSRSTLDDWLENVAEQTASTRAQIGGYRCVALSSTAKFINDHDAGNPLNNFNLSCADDSSSSGPRPTSVARLRLLFQSMPVGALSEEGERERTKLLQHLEALEEQEQAAVDEFYQGLNQLKPNISFDWLYHEGAGWVLELIVWSIYGVLASAIAGLIKAYKSGTYDGRLFLLFIPRLFLAPLLSVVITAFISSGESGYQVNLQNLPAFLVFAFAMGFNSESLTRTIRELFNRIFADAEENAKNAATKQDVEKAAAKKKAEEAAAEQNAGAAEQNPGDSEAGQENVKGAGAKQTAEEAAIDQQAEPAANEQTVDDTESKKADDAVTKN